MKGIYFNLCRTFLIFKVWPVLCANICTYATSEKFYQQIHVMLGRCTCKRSLQVDMHVYIVYANIVPIGSQTFLESLIINLYPAEDMQKSGLCSRWVWQLLPTVFFSQATCKFQFLHKSHMLGTLDFLGLKVWVTFNFSQSKKYVY